ncbi:uncharacterized protein FIBRA_01670 [Fibroporia radiculosa]|uniref:Uncharacterized protein n=1 Tax=Fibroporia radiculosa TaxID=599839 RepID=J4GKZ1_9APHY|nr:uncharacterized protein FIBRA_01670 [Fibroporia radiculosa]CCL99650.1 predicted protein [Fibroporia radiculosa]
MFFPTLSSWWSASSAVNEHAIQDAMEQLRELELRIEVLSPVLDLYHARVIDYWVSARGSMSTSSGDVLLGRELADERLVLITRFWTIYAELILIGHKVYKIPSGAKHACEAFERRVRFVAVGVELAESCTLCRLINQLTALRYPPRPIDTFS